MCKPLYNAVQTRFHSSATYGSNLRTADARELLCLPMAFPPPWPPPWPKSPGSASSGSDEELEDDDDELDEEQAWQLELS
jgi:hypothetical protein